jgi:hypothetical protein
VRSKQRDESVHSRDLTHIVTVFADAGEMYTNEHFA